MSDENSTKALSSRISATLSALRESPLAEQKKTHELTARQKVFVAEYLTDFNGTQAALRAGYTTRHPTRAATSLMANPLVAAAVRAGVKARVDRLGMDADDVLLRALNLYDIAMAGEPVMRWDKDAKCRVATGEYVFDGALAAKALEMIGKILGAFRDRPTGEERPFLIQIFTESKE